MRGSKTLSGYARALAVAFVSSAKTRSRHPSLLAWDNYSSQPFGASSILLLKAAGTLKYASKIAPLTRLRSSRTVLFPDALATSGVGFVQPSSRSQRSPHLKSYSRQRKPTRLQVITGNPKARLILFLLFRISLLAFGPSTKRQSESTF